MLRQTVHVVFINDVHLLQHSLKSTQQCASGLPLGPLGKPLEYCRYTQAYNNQLHHAAYYELQTEAADPCERSAE